MKFLVLAMVAGVSIYSPVNANPIPLGEYLTSVDRTEVQFSGRIKYQRRDGDFTFYDENRASFGVTIDAGRDARERIEQDCENSDFLVSLSELCSITGSGTIEIRGSRIYISIEAVDQLSQ